MGGCVSHNIIAVWTVAWVASKSKIERVCFHLVTSLGPYGLLCQLQLWSVVKKKKKSQFVSLLVISLASAPFFFSFSLLLQSCIERNFKSSSFAKPQFHGRKVYSNVCPTLASFVTAGSSSLTNQQEIHRKFFSSLMIECLHRSRFFWRYFIGWIRNLFWVKAQIRFVRFSLFLLYFWLFFFLFLWG